MDLPVIDVSARGAVPQYVPATPPLPAVAPPPSNDRSASNGQQFGDPQRRPADSAAASKALLSSDTLDVLRRLTQEASGRRGADGNRFGSYSAGQREISDGGLSEGTPEPGTRPLQGARPEQQDSIQFTAAEPPFEALRRARFAYDQAQQSSPSYPHAQKAEVLDFVA